MPARPLITFVAATYNRGPTLIDCVRRTLFEGIAPLSLDQVRFIIIDNASTDDTLSLIKNSNLPLHLIPLPKNCGPVAKNVGIRHTLRSGSAYIIILDDDAYPLPGSVEKMLHHFQNNPTLGAAVFDVQLPDGSREASAYPDVFIGAGTGFRAEALLQAGLFPGDYFMQAEEYDLSFRLWNAGWEVTRFSDMPLLHLKTPGARIGQRTTGLDVRNNLYLLARYLPDTLAYPLAADWLSRYWMMAENRDARQPPDPRFGTHRKSFLRGAAQGLERWTEKRDNNRHLLKPETIERLFKFDQIRNAMKMATAKHHAKTILFADFGKNMLAYHLAAQDLALNIIAIADEGLGKIGRDYRDIPIRKLDTISQVELARADLIVVSNMSPIQGPKRAAELRSQTQIPIELLV